MNPRAKPSWKRPPALNDELMEKFFEDGELSFDDMMHGLRQGIKDGTVVPVVCCSGITRVGLSQAAGQHHRPDALSGRHVP